MKTLILFITFLAVAFSAIASECKIVSADNTKMTGFFNGMLVTEFSADISVKMLKKITKKPVSLFYNHTQGLTLDLLETYQQRVSESYPMMAGRYDLMEDMLSASGPVSQRLMASGDAGIVASIRAFRDAVGKLEREATVHVASMTNADYREHISQLRKMANEDVQAMLVAHSQGNLFVNHAYEALGAADQEKVEVLHVAPASIRLHGKYLLSDLDLVIQPLAAAVSRSPSDALSYFEAKISLASDWAGHGFNEVYLNSGLPFVKQIVESVDGKDAVSASTDKLYGSYRWDGSSRLPGMSGAGWFKVSINGKQGSWSSSNGCEGDMSMESSGSLKWVAHMRTKRGSCPDQLNVGVEAVGKDGQQIAVLPFGVSRWLFDAVKPYLAGLGIKGNNLLVCAKT